MQQHTPKVYVLILNYCSGQDTLECVQSVKASGYENTQILVIDNKSPDGSGEWLKQHISPSEFLQLPKNIGYTGGNNKGIKISLEGKADYIFILNPDVRIKQGAIKHYVSTLEDNPKIGALNPVQLDASGNSIDKKFSLGIFKRHGIKPPSIQEMHSQLWSVNHLYGAAIIFPASTIFKIGGLDPLYFAYGEEEDFCRRILFHGSKLAVTGGKPILHLRTHENNGVHDKVLFLRVKGHYLLPLKNPNIPFKIAFKKLIKDWPKDLLGKSNHPYPFKMYPIKKKHTLLAIFWILRHCFSIAKHKKLEKKGRAHV